MTEEVGAENDTCGVAWAWIDPAEGHVEMGWVGSMGRRVLKNSLIRVFDIHFQWLIVKSATLGKRQLLNRMDHTAQRPWMEDFEKVDTHPYPWPFFQLCHHDNCGTPLLPYHSPKVPKCLRKRSLCCNIGILLPIPIYVVCIHIVTSGDTCKTWSY